jgi:phosphatidylserine/phosphatidylglycerophosphate/cardiolipin synthase-like enzyme
LINYQQIQIWISIQELSLDLRAAITYLRVDHDDTSILSEPTRLLIQEYQSKYRFQPINLPAKLVPDVGLTPKIHLGICRRKNRDILQNIINSANRFLLISSYVIEDEKLTELICEKSRQLSQGVWILTDLRDEILDRIDQQVSNSTYITLLEQYKKSDQRKKTCFRMLLNANIPIRSGNFHLKTYISEQYAYLGSCNLTQGSLDFNLEAGIIFSNNLQHQALINLFCEFWQKNSTDEVVADNNLDGFRLRSLLRVNQESFKNSDGTILLTPAQYERDLSKNLRNFKGQVKIYSRSFLPSPEIAASLSFLDTSIFIASGIVVNHEDFNIHRIDNLHAKITILGDEIAYIGGVNFNFGDLHLHDLMYKTTNTREINQIASLISSLY